MKNSKNAELDRINNAKTLLFDKFIQGVFNYVDNDKLMVEFYCIAGPTATVFYINLWLGELGISFEDIEDFEDELDPTFFEYLKKGIIELELECLDLSDFQNLNKGYINTEDYEVIYTR
jgi:hypothetical protein